MKYNFSVLPMSESVPQVIQKTIDDIIAIKIQGATNVALSTFITIGEWAQETDITNMELFRDKLGQYMEMLANARPNEPLAKNGVRYIQNQLILQYPGLKDVKSGKKNILKSCLNIGKKKIM